MELQRDIINTQTLCFGVCENMRPVVVRHKDNLPRRGLLWVHCHEMPRHDAHKQLFFFCQTSWKTFTVTVNCMILQYIPGILGKTVWHGGSNLGSVAGCWEFSIFRAKASVLSVPGMASLQSCKNQRSNMIDFVFHRLLKPCLDHWYFKTIERQHHVKIVRVFWQFFFGSLACSSRDVESSSRD